MNGDCIRRFTFCVCALGTLVLLHGGPLAYAGAEPTAAQSVLKDAKGRVLGKADLAETPHGVAVRVHFEGMPPGTHAFHIHDVGQCQPPFDSAGGHFNPGGKKHGFANPDGWHAGDLPSIHVPDSGALEIEVFAPGVRLGGPRGLLDQNGAALMVHEGPDDYRSDPAGNAGARIACGAIEKK